MSLKLGALNSRAEQETVWPWLPVSCTVLVSEEVCHSFYQNLKDIPDPREAKNRPPPRLLNFTHPLPSTPIHTFPHHTLELTLQGHVLVTKSLKAELPEALALDRALVDEGASRGL